MQQVTEQLWVSGALTVQEIEALARRACRLVVDLRDDAEPTRGLRPWEERRIVAGLGMAYHQIPVGVASFDNQTVAKVRRVLRSTNGCVLVHCTTGRRAAALALIHLYCDARRSLDDTLERAHDLGLDGAGVAGLSAWWRDYVARHAASDAHASRGESWSV